MVLLGVASWLLGVGMLPGGPVIPPQGTCSSDDARGCSRVLAVSRGVGKVLATIVGPGPAAGSRRVYLSYVHYGEPLEIVAVQESSRDVQVFSSPVRSELGAWSLIEGPDGRIYAGTFPNGHVLRLDPTTGVIRDLGRPAPSETHIWEFAIGSDGRIYGCTYPSAKLIRVDPETGELRDLGRVDVGSHYARSIAADDAGMIYVGTGSARAGIVAYEISTGAKRDLTPPGMTVAGFGRVHSSGTGKVYAAIGEHRFSIAGTRLSEMRAADWPAPSSPVWREGLFIRPGNTAELELVDAGGRVIRRQEFEYPGRPIHVFRLGLGPDGLLYGSTLLPNHVFRIDPRNGDLEKIGTLGGGETYAFVSVDSKLYAALYGGTAPLIVYDPTRPFAPSSRSGSNPLLIYPPQRDDGWRPMAMLAALDGSIYVGAVPGYGRVEGVFGQLRPDVNKFVPMRSPVAGQSVVSLAYVKGRLVGGTDVNLGLGTDPVAAEAVLFVWDPSSKDTVFTTIPVPGAERLTDLVVGADGLVYGFAAPDVLFRFDVDELRVVSTTAVPFTVGTPNTYNSIARASDGTLWGLAKEGVFAVTPGGEASLVSRVPRPVTAGFAFAGERLYYATGAVVWEYRLPHAANGAPHEPPVDDVRRAK